MVKEKTASHRVATSDDIEVSTYLELAKESRGEQAVLESEEPPGKRETIIIIDFGSQYSMLIARRVRECHVYCEIVPHNTPWEKIAPLNPRGIILSGGPHSVYEHGAPLPLPYVYETHLPVLGVCYGMQAIAYQLGGEVVSGAKREYGHAVLHINALEDPLFTDLPSSLPVWMSHGDQIEGLGEDFIALAATPTCPYAAVKHKTRQFYGLQFHPEVTHTPHGGEIFDNFLYDICGCAGLWRMSSFIDSVVEAMLHKEIGERLECSLVDNGCLRLNEVELVESTFRKHFHANLTTVRAAEAFLKKIEGVTEPQEKRKIIGHTFIDVFKEAARKIPNAKYLAQGTLYPDVIESGHSLAGQAANIKLHHNVGGLPAELGFELIEPLRDLFKDEVRQVGELLGLPEQMVWRHPFPGPGLAVRCLGLVTPDRLNVLRKADNILLEEITANHLYRKTAQTFAVLLPVQSVGVMGDGRTYENVVAVRSVDTSDFMTADWSRIPYDVLATISNRIINEVRGVNRVVYDISSKPPATIEWE